MAAKIRKYINLNSIPDIQLTCSSQRDVQKTAKGSGLEAICGPMLHKTVNNAITPMEQSIAPKA